MTKEQIITIIMKRDDLNHAEATALVNECALLIDDALDMGMPEEVEDILSSYLGLELDYVMAFV